MSYPHLTMDLPFSFFMGKDIKNRTPCDFARNLTRNILAHKQAKTNKTVVAPREKAYIEGLVNKIKRAGSRLFCNEKVKKKI